MYYAWILAIVIVILSFIKWYSARNDDYWKKKGIEYMPRVNLITMFYMLSKANMGQVIRDMVKGYGRVVGSFEGSAPSVTVTDPNILRDILVKDFHIFPYRRIMKTYDPIADAMVTMITGEDWKRVRTIITPAFTSKRMRQMASIMNDCSKTLLEVCEKHCNEGKPLDAKGAFGAFTMDVIASSAFGTKIDSHNDPENEFVKNVKRNFASFTFTRMIFAFYPTHLAGFAGRQGVSEASRNRPELQDEHPTEIKDLYNRVFIPGWILRWIPLDLNPMILDKSHFFRDITMNVIKRRKESGRRYNDFLQMLMDIADETSENENREAAEDETDRFGSVTHNEMTSFASKNKKLSNTELLAQCVLFFMVGYETTNTVLTFAAYCLATNPEWQEKLIKEVDETFEKHSKMSYDVVREMKVLDAVVSETLRMHPPIGSGERTAVEEYKLGDTGIVIEKGMRVVFLFYAMHYDPEFFPDPETFNPERFMEGYEPKHPQYAYLPFGAGPRNCLGMRFALLEIKMCLANLLRHYRLKPHTTTKVPLEYKKGAIFLTVNELPLTVEKRTDSKLKS